MFPLMGGVGCGKPDGGVIACMAIGEMAGESAFLHDLRPFPSSPAGFSRDSNAGGELAVNAHARGV